MKNKLFALLALTFLSTLNPQLSTLFAQGTAFTYQGRLTSGSSPANGSHDLTFTLFGANAGGVAIVGPVTNSATTVSNGLFTAIVDFGANFLGAERWLEIGVRTNGGGAFTTLAPRQKITATPYAITAGNFTGTLSDGQLPANLAKLNANQTFSGANNFSSPVGLGVANGNTKLAVWDGPTSAMGLGVRTGQFRFHLPDSNNRFSFLDNSDGNELVTIKGTGEVGIGTNAPAEKLEVRGNIKVGANAELFVPGGQENLRIVRGIFQVAGPFGAKHAVVVNGSAYSVVRFSDGLFIVNFIPAFSDVPVVHVTVHEGGSDITEVRTLNSSSMGILVSTSSLTPRDPSSFVMFSAIGGR